MRRRLPDIWDLTGERLVADRAAYPMYEKALELGIPVMVHTGPEPKPLYSRYCQPVYVDDVAPIFRT